MQQNNLGSVLRLAAVQERKAPHTHKGGTQPQPYGLLSCTHRVAEAGLAASIVPEVPFERWVVRSEQTGAYKLMPTNTNSSEIKTARTCRGSICLFVDFFYTVKEMRSQLCISRCFCLHYTNVLVGCILSEPFVQCPKCCISCWLTPTGGGFCFVFFLTRQLPFGTEQHLLKT